jgi:hypothetical protein
MQGQHDDSLQDLMASFLQPLPPRSPELFSSPEARRLHLLQVVDSAIAIVDETLAGIDSEVGEGQEGKVQEGENGAGGLAKGQQDPERH